MITFYSPEAKNGCFSNWYESKFVIDATEFICAEQYMMYKKALLFGDEKTAGEILSERKPVKIRALGRRVKDFDDTVWNGMRQGIVTDALFAKFSQNEELGRLLLETGDEVIAECSPSDLVWGTGLAVDSPKATDMAAWRGQNLLGFSLMAVREKLRGTAHCNSCRTYFSITGDFDHRAITALLQIEPFEAWNKGDLRRDGRPYGFSAWRCGLCDKYDPYTFVQMEETIRILNGKTAELETIRERYQVSYTLEVVPKLCPDQILPALAPSRTVMEFCCKTGTELDIDTYID